MDIDKGVIPGKYTFIPVAQAENGTVAKGEPVTLTVEKSATGMDILANHLNVTNGLGTDKSNPPTYTVPINTAQITFRPQKIQSDATLPNQGDAIWESSDPYVATIDRNTGKFTAKHPGSTIITMKYSGTLKGEPFEKTCYVKVVVPIAEFEFGNVDWENAVKNGKKYSDLTMPVTRVRSFEGEWIDNDRYMEAKCTQASSFTTGNNWSLRRTVSYNDSVRVQFKAVAKEGYQLLLKPHRLNYAGEVSAYVADISNIKTHAVGSTAMDTALKLGYNFLGECSLSESPSLCGIIIPVDQPCLQDPNARYLDTVSVTTEEPREGDSRYQGDNAEEYITSALEKANMMNAKVLTLMNGGNPISVYQSLVSKVSAVQGSGIAYDPVSYEDYTANNTECFGTVLGTSSQPDTVAKLTKPRYEAATYIHDLTLNINGTDSDGKQVFFSPDVKIFVNGRPVELIINGYNGSVESGYLAQSLHMIYYYVSDPSPAFTGGTVSGLTAPITGETPVSESDLTVSAVRSDNTASDDALYVSRLTWYVDSNNNNEFDSGEDTDIFSSDGKFKADTVYSAYIELAANENMGRIDNQSFTLKLNTGAAQPSILNTTQAKGSYKFSKTNPPPGVAVSGKATSFGSDGEKVKIELIKSGNTSADYSTEITGNSTDYSIPAVESGTYTLRVSKKNHAAREYTLTVGTSDVTLDVKIHLLGDINGDGKVTFTDVNKAKLHYKNKSILSGYEFICSDVNGDGKITFADVNKIKLHYKNKSLLW